MHAVKKGQVMGHTAPYGYCYIRKSDTAPAHWEVDPQEAYLVRLVFDLYVNKRMTGTSIARHLERKGYPTKSGSFKWWGSVVYSILKNETYIGTAYMFKHSMVKPSKSPKDNKYRGKKNTLKKVRPREDWIGILVTPLIEKKTWEAAQDILKENVYKSRRNNKSNNYLLRGLVICGECGCMAPGYVSNKNTYYSCGAKRNKNITTKPHDDINIAVRYHPFDDKIWNGLVELLQEPNNLKKQMEKRLSRKNSPSNSAKSEQTKIEKDIRKLDVQEKRLLDAYRESIIEIDELKEQKAKIARNRRALSAKQIAALSQLEGSGRPEITMTMLGEVSARFQRVMAKSDFAIREKLANLLINSVTLYKNKAIVKGNVPVIKGDVLNPSNQREPFPLTEAGYCVRIQKMNARTENPIKPKEYDVLDAISQDSTITQSGLASRLGIAVGSVNWYIKRLVSRGYVKVSRMDRTRLQYNLTPEGMTVFTERAMQYAKDSLKIYKDFRQMAKDVVAELKGKGVFQVYLEGDDEIMDIMRLTCLEAEISLSETPCDVTLSVAAKKYQYTVNGLSSNKQS